VPAAMTCTTHYQPGLQADTQHGVATSSPASMQEHFCIHAVQLWAHLPASD
jgi:hypothetical protein